MISIKTSNNLKLLGFLGFLGNAVEFYEFTVYAIFASFFASYVFPSDEPLISLLSSWGAFATAFFMRPFGGLVFGWIGDRYGRRIALTSSMILMGLSTTGIGLLVGYEEIGVLSPMLLILFRMFQGLSTGGEYNGSAIFLIEHFGNKKAGFIGGIITSSCVLGALLGTFIGNYFKDSGVEEAWRYPFIIGGLFSFILFFLRKKMIEPPIYNKSENSSQGLYSFIFNNINKFMQNVFVGALNGSLSYFVFGFSAVYMSKYVGLDAEKSFICNIMGLLTFFVMNPICGILYDKMETNKYFCLAPLACCVLIYPSVLLLMTSNIYGCMVGMFCIGVLTASIAGPGHAFLKNGVPTKLSYRFVSFSFSAGMAIAGGTSPSIIIYAIEKGSLMLSPAIYISIVALSLFVFLIYREKEPSLLNAQ